MNNVDVSYDGCEKPTYAVKVQDQCATNICNFQINKIGTFNKSNAIDNRRKPRYE